MKRLWPLILTLVIAMAAIGGAATMAMYGGQTAPTGNQFVSGTLQISGDRDSGDSVPGPMFYIGAGGGLIPTGEWAPGDEFHRVLQVENTGTMDAWLKYVRATLESGSRPLADKLMVKVTTDPAGASVVATGTLGQFIDADQAFIGGPLSSDVGDVTDLHFWVKLPSDADNTYQSLSTVAAFTVYAEQKANNP